MAEDPWSIVLELEVVFCRRREFVTSAVDMLALQIYEMTQATQTQQN